MNCGVARTLPSGRLVLGVLIMMIVMMMMKMMVLWGTNRLLLLDSVIQDVFANRLIEAPGRLKEIHQ